MLVSNQRPLPCEVCQADHNASCLIEVFRIVTPTSPLTESMFSYHLLVFSAQVAAQLQHADLSDNSRAGPPERRTITERAFSLPDTLFPLAHAAQPTWGWERKTSTAE